MPGLALRVTEADHRSLATIGPLSAAAQEPDAPRRSVTWARSRWSRGA